MGTLSVVGGADVGGSCYIVENDGIRVMLDCGLYLNDRYEEHPNIPSPETIDAIFITHAHLDHMGAIAYAAAFCPNAKILMTEKTRIFIRYQLEATIGRYIGADTNALKYSNALLCQLILNRTEIIDYNEKYEAIRQNDQIRIVKLSDPSERAARTENTEEKRFFFSAFRAGHIPGAAMIFLKLGNKTVLYTGDFTKSATELTSGYSLPENLSPNVLLLCGVHANKKDGTLIPDYIMKSTKDALSQSLKQYHNLRINISQLTKGLEIITLIDSMLTTGTLPKCSVYIDEPLWTLACRYEMTSPTFRLPKNCMKHISQLDESVKEYRILLTSSSHKNKFHKYKEINANFSLHADYKELVGFIRKIGAPKVFVVHVSNPKSERQCLQEEFLTDRRICVHYTNNNEIYEL